MACQMMSAVFDTPFDKQEISLHFLFSSIGSVSVDGMTGSGWPGSIRRNFELAKNEETSMLGYKLLQANIGQAIWDWLNIYSNVLP